MPSQLRIPNASSVVAKLLRSNWRFFRPPEYPAVPFITYFPAVLCVSLYAGLRPAVVCIIVSAVAGKYFFIPPLRSFELDTAAGLITILRFVPRIIRQSRSFLCRLNETITGAASQPARFSPRGRDEASDPCQRLAKNNMAASTQRKWGMFIRSCSSVGQM